MWWAVAESATLPAARCQLEGVGQAGGAAVGIGVGFLGSYYTHPEVVGATVSLVDEALRSKRFGLHVGLASSSVTMGQA